MNILVYIGHPAQYHFFKNALTILKHKGHAVRLLIKSKDVLEDLVCQDNWNYINIQTTYRKNNKFSILKAAFQRTWTVTKIARKFHADILMGTDSSIAQAAWLLRKPALTTLEDDIEIIPNLAKLTFPFTSYIVTPTVCRIGKWEKKKIGYDGYMKLAYLHPNHFTPDRSILSHYGITNDYILLRLAKLTAHHDKGIKGLNIKLVKNIINIAAHYGYKVFISSEADLDKSLEEYRLKINPKDIHHIMAFTHLLISDSQSMSVEAAMLGIPSIRFSDFAGKISVLEELEHTYNLTFGISTSHPEKLLQQLHEMLELNNLKEVFRERHQLMLNDKIDVTSFLVWLIDQYPQSIYKIKQKTDFQVPFYNTSK